MVNNLMELLEVEVQVVPALDYADTLRHEVSPTLDPKQRKKLGQFMTPAPVATFMAGMFDQLPKNIRLLDAGAGVGSLTAAFVREVCKRKNRPRSIDVTNFEIDSILGQHLAETLAPTNAWLRGSPSPIRLLRKTTYYTPYNLPGRSCPSFSIPSNMIVPFSILHTQR